jgi:hypothetical protein
MQFEIEPIIEFQDSHIITVTSEINFVMESGCHSFHNILSSHNISKVVINVKCISIESIGHLRKSGSILKMYTLKLKKATRV